VSQPRAEVLAVAVIFISFHTKAVAMQFITVARIKSYSGVEFSGNSQNKELDLEGCSKPTVV